MAFVQLIPEASRTGRTANSPAFLVPAGLTAVFLRVTSSVWPPAPNGIFIWYHIERAEVGSDLSNPASWREITMQDIEVGSRLRDGSMPGRRIATNGESFHARLWAHVMNAQGQDATATFGAERQVE